MTSCETPTSQEVSIQNSKPNIIRKTNIAWSHCKLIQEGGKIAMMWIYCDKIVKVGGISRLMGHLVGERGQVSFCKKVPPDVRYRMKQNIEENKSKNKKRRIDEHDFYSLSEEGGEVHTKVEQQSEQTQRTTEKVKTSDRIGNYF